MTDIKKISPAVQQEIKTISKMGASKKRIDTMEEFQKLQELAKRLETEGNASEKEYVQGLMVEYQNQKAANDTKIEEKKLMNQVTDNARKAMKNIKKIIPDKKELNEAEARMVLDLIKNTKGEFNKADIEYFKQELIKAGFGNMLNEVEDKKNTEKAEPQELPKTDDAKNTENEIPKLNDLLDESTNEPKPEKDIAKPDDSSTKSEPDKSEGNSSPRPISRPEKKQSPKNEDNPKSTKPITEPQKPSKYIISDTAKTHGQKIAKELFSEIHKPIGTMSDNSKVKEHIHEVDENTAYSFLVEYTYSDGDRYLQLNRDTYGLSDIFNRITANEAKHIISALLKQAKGMNLQDTKAYKNLANLQQSMNAALHGKSDPDDKLQFRLDGALTDMMNEMTKVIQ